MWVMHCSGDLAFHSGLLGLLLGGMIWVNGLITVKAPQQAPLFIIIVSALIIRIAAYATQ